MSSGEAKGHVFSDVWGVCLGVSKWPINRKVAEHLRGRNKPRVSSNASGASGNDCRCNARPRIWPLFRPMRNSQLFTHGASKKAFDTAMAL